MNIRNILVEVAQGATSDARLQTAINLGKALDAKLTALFVVPNFVPTTLMSGTMQGGWYAGAELVEKFHQSALELAQEVKHRCAEIAEENSVHLEWTAVEGEVIGATTDSARYHDLLIVGVPDTVNDPKFYDGDLGGILMNSGRPVMVTPGVEPMLQQIPERVMIAWDGGRESTKAVLEAMPFLTLAREVAVVSVCKRSEQEQELTVQAERLTRYLGTHDINATARVIERGHDTTANKLVEFADDSGIGLIVMGAYGHSRFQELVLGGVTRDIVYSTPVPILFSH